MRGSLVALVTPMHADGAVDYAAVDQLIDWHVEAGTSALVIAGTTGEAATLTRAEHAELICHAARQAGGRIPIVAGTGSNSTAQTIALSQAVAGADIVAYLIVTPYYNKPTQEGMVLHFSAIADAVEQPLILYNVPGRTGVDLLPETIGRLAEHPRIGACKEATGEVERVARLRALCGEEFGLYSGDDVTARAFMLAGGDGVISVTANVAPGRWPRCVRPPWEAMPTALFYRMRPCGFARWIVRGIQSDSGEMGAPSHGQNRSRHPLAADCLVRA